MSLPGHAAHLAPIERIAAGVAHTFNNLLTAIQGYSSMELSKAEPCTALADSLREISTAAERGATITQKLLACAAQQILCPGPVDVYRHLIHLAPTLYALVPSPVTLHLELVPSLPKLIVDDENLTEILVQLVGNARDAIRQTGSVQVSTAYTDIPAQRLPNASGHLRSPAPGPHIRLTVSDNGTGIPLEVLPHIFEPFFTTKQSTRVFGLGLAVVQGIVQQHRGWIEVETVLGRGSSFHVFLPSEPGQRIPSPAPQFFVRPRIKTPRGFPV